jgi:hypothetical protein
MVDLAKSLTDQLLERHLAKNRQPNVQQQLLDDLVLAQNSRVPLNQVEVDPTGTFSASSQTDLGIMNEGLGNIVNSFLNPTRVATARTNERNKLTQANSDRAYQQSIDQMNAQIAGDATQYSRGQDDVKNLQKQQELDLEANPRLDPSQQLAYEEEKKRLELNAKRKQLFSSLFNQGVGANEQNRITAEAKKLGFSTDEIAPLAQGYAAAHGQVGDRSTDTTESTQYSQDANQYFNDTVITPIQNEITATLKRNNLTEAVMEDLSTPKLALTQGNLDTVFKDLETLDSDGKKVRLKNDDYNAVVDLAAYLMDKTGGKADVGLLKDAALLGSSDGRVFNIDFDSDKGKKMLDTLLAKRGFGDSEEAQRVNASVAEYSALKRKMADMSTQFQRTREKEDLLHRQQYGNQLVNHLYAQGEAPATRGKFGDADKARINKMFGFTPPTQAASQISSPVVTPSQVTRPSMITRGNVTVPDASGGYMNPGLKQVVDSVTDLWDSPKAPPQSKVLAGAFSGDAATKANLIKKIRDEGGVQLNGQQIDYYAVEFAKRMKITPDEAKGLILESRSRK